MNPTIADIAEAHTITDRGTTYADNLDCLLLAARENEIPADANHELTDEQAEALEEFLAAI